MCRAYITQSVFQPSVGRDFRRSKQDYLQTPDISSNNLTGALPPFLKSLHRLTFLNVSFNNFRGPIPVSGVFQHLNLSSFQGNPGLCGSIIHKQCRPPASHPHVRRKPFFILGATLAATAVLLGCVAVLAACFHYRTRAAFQGENFLAAETRRFTAEELALATQGYAETNLLGQGTHAAVYKGVLSDGMIVSVKKLKERCAQEVLLKEAHILSKLRHRNLVRVRGCVLNLDVSALVLDYMPEGSLEHYLHDRREHEEYDWRRLTTIATGLANALIYLHHEYGMPIIHGDIKPSNILLDSNLEAHLADFGLSKLGKDGVFSIVSNFKGAIGYMAPEYAYAAEATTKVDVYSFGVVILEMLTGQKPTEVSGGVSLHEWVLDKLSEGSGSSVLQELLDARLVQSVQSPTKVGQMDSTIYTRHTSESILVLAIYVDDIPIMSDKEDVLIAAKKELSQAFPFTDGGPISYYLGLLVQRDYQKATISLSQSRYVAKDLQRFNLSSCKGVDIPLTPSVKLISEMTPVTPNE
ncbi:hypothetical protein L7F22_054587 [Adiantum nelumboides]|nr:hypothetical protein [Adiantum nelumboides]